MQIVQIPLLADNYAYLIHDDGITAVIDPSEADPVLDELGNRDWQLNYIINTHHHFDHVGGNSKLKQNTSCTIICSHTDLNRIPNADVAKHEGDTIAIGSARALVMEIPGHTLGHIALWFKEQNALFCGDTLFSLGCGRLFEGTPQQMWESLQRLAILPPETKIYCGHEYTQANAEFALSVDPNNQDLRDYCQHVAQLRASGLPTIPSTMEIETKANPFLRAPQLIGESISPTQAFARLRTLKDNSK